MGRFPATRLRRGRADPWTRRLVAETNLTVDNLVWPVFVRDGQRQREAIASMPGIERLSIDELVDAAIEAHSVGIPAIAIFPVISRELKTPDGVEATNPDNLACRAIRAVKSAVPALGLFTDVALDPYTSHGHDGLFRDGQIVNDETIAVLARQAVNAAAAGVDIIAPSDMMDGTVGAVRAALDLADRHMVRICAYSAKYASSYYGPFRDAIRSEGLLVGDKRTYQMDPANSAEALREVAQDIDEGADMIMVKPGLPYLDILRRIKDNFAMPTLAYQVSGEYAMLRAAASQGWVSWEATLLETLVCFRRAGADAIFTYAAMDAARLIRQG